MLIGVDHPTQDLVHARVLAAQGGLVVGDPAGVRDRFMIDGKDAGGRFALVQHLFAPRALAAPMHRHHKEDEYTYVLEGRIGAILGDEEVVGEPGDLIFKPRNQWHTFWNAGDEPASALEIISPAGLEQFSAPWAPRRSRLTQSRSPHWRPLTNVTPISRLPPESSSGTGLRSDYQPGDDLLSDAESLRYTWRLCAPVRDLGCVI